MDLATLIERPYIFSVQIHRQWDYLHTDDFHSSSRFLGLKNFQAKKNMNRLIFLQMIFVQVVGY